MRKPVNSDTSVVVDPTEPRASALENLPTTATSAMLNMTCKSCDSMSGMLNKKMFFQSDPWVIGFCPSAFWLPSCDFPTYDPSLIP